MIDEEIHGSVRDDHRDNIDRTPAEREYREHVRHLLDQGDLSTTDFRMVHSDGICHCIRHLRLNAIGRRANIREDESVGNYIDQGW